MTYDRRTGKPVASHIVLLNSGSQSYEVLSEEKFTGSIAQEAKPTKNKNVRLVFSATSREVPPHVLVSDKFSLWGNC